MIRLNLFFAICAIILVSCGADVNEDMQDLVLESQLIGVENAHNAALREI